MNAASQNDYETGASLLLPLNGFEKRSDSSRNDKKGKLSKLVEFNFKMIYDTHTHTTHIHIHMSYSV